MDSRRKGKFKEHFSQKAPHLGLVTHGGHAAVVDEGEDSLGVVPGDEFCGLAHIVHVCAVGGAGHLPGAQGESPPLAGSELGFGVSRERFQMEQFKSGDSQDKAVLEKGNRALTWSLPMATRQNLLPWPASGSSSGRETPGRGGPTIPARLVQEKCLVSGEWTSIHLSALLCNPSP